MRLPFELDPNIIHHIIHSQAGSIGKACIELLMNSVDASARSASLELTKHGFLCTDDGNGFASREDVLRYFGRFGTPHQEGDATYGRFRLGRGQIMAHASTRWRSNAWRMDVDTKVMGYSYELTDADSPTPGCSIEGTWYEPLNEAELQSTIQELRDLIRYTPISVMLNGHLISRDPAKEKWDHEDEYAYYRVKEEGPVSIYNLGVLVRHDPPSEWGAGGLVVSKKAIGLNVSRTEILRKTCTVWRPIAKQFARMADEMAARLGDHRKTEARRQKYARAALAGDPKIYDIYYREEIITVLPGKKHITLSDFHRLAGRSIAKAATIVGNAFDVPTGEAIARGGVAAVIHPSTIHRFGCYSQEELADCLQRIANHMQAACKIQSDWLRANPVGDKPVPLIDFETLKENFTLSTSLVDESKELDKETRRAWGALRYCLLHYAFHLGYFRKNGCHIVVGRSNQAEAWTDGHTYIAINIEHVKRLRTDPLRAAGKIFSIFEHELAHDGDSLDCGHDEAFYQRFHDITVASGDLKQYFLHIWLRKYTRSLEMEGKHRRDGWKAWQERELIDRAGNGRIARGLGPAIEDLSAHPFVIGEPVPISTEAFNKLVASAQRGADQPAQPDWRTVAKAALATFEQRMANYRRNAEDFAMSSSEFDDELLAERNRIIAELQLTGEDADLVLSRAQFAMNLWGLTGDLLRSGFEAERDDFNRPRSANGFGHDNLASDRHPEENTAAWDEMVASERSEDVRSAVNSQMLKRNAAAAGFLDVNEYLKWRQELQ